MLGCTGQVQDVTRALRLPVSHALVLVCACTLCLPAGAGTQSKEAPGRTDPPNS
jgi:hypothetical protein